MLGGAAPPALGKQRKAADSRPIVQTFTCAPPVPSVAFHYEENGSPQRRQGLCSLPNSRLWRLLAPPLMDASFSFQPDISTGNCWAFQGSRGHVVIRLPEKIWPTAFTLWHISKAVSPSGEVSTAPREFAVSVSLCPLLLLEGPKEQLCHRAPSDHTEPRSHPTQPRRAS